MASCYMKKIGIIGYGKIGENHRRALEALGAEVICSANRSKEGRTNGKAAGIPKQYADYRQMLTNEDLDGVVCSTSLFSNFRVALDVISTGLPLLLEKPPGTSEEELEQLIAAQKKSKSIVQVATNRVWYTVFDQAIHEIGGLSEVQNIRMEWSENPYRLMEKRGFNKSQVLSRNFSNTIHAFSIINKFAGAVHFPQVYIHKGKNEFDYEMAFQGISEREVGVQFISSWSNPIPWSISVYGNSKYLRFAPLEQCVCKNLQTGEKVTFEGDNFDKEFKPGFYNQAKHFLSLLDGGGQDSLTKLTSMRILFEYAKILTPKHNG